MRILNALDVHAILHQWRRGELSASEVHAWAEDRYNVGGWECASEAVNAVLQLLDTMNMNLVVSDDIPVLISALDSADFESILAEYDRQVDVAERKRTLRDIPFYARFCR